VEPPLIVLLLAVAFVLIFPFVAVLFLARDTAAPKPPDIG
jgi:hypothetical protein